MPDDDLDYGYSERPERRGLDELGGGDGRVEQPARKEPRDATRQMKQGAIEEVRDHQEPPVTRVRYGKLGDGVQDYGLEVYDASGNLVLSATGLGVDVVDTDQLVDGAVTTPKVTDGAVVASKLTESSKAFGADLTFSATDDDTVAWTSGEIELADGTTYSINAGDTGAMGGLTYIYLDPNASETTLQTTTSITTATGEEKVLLAVAKPASSTSQEAFVVPAVGVLSLNEENLSPNSISTTQVQADAIQANQIDVVNLEAIKADLGTITAGLLQNAAGTNEIDLDASGTDPYILSSQFRVLADGTIQFGGSSGNYSGIHERAFDEHDLVGIDANSTATTIRWRVTGTDLTDYESILEALNTAADPDVFDSIIRIGTDARPRFGRPVQFGSPGTNLGRNEPLSVSGDAFISGELLIGTDPGGSEALRVGGAAHVDALQLDNHEQADFDLDGLLYWDASAGLYIKSSNADTNPRLLWSGANFTAGPGVLVSYDSEDEPTLSVDNRVVHHGTGSASAVGETGALHTEDA